MRSKETYAPYQNQNLVIFWSELCNDVTTGCTIIPHVCYSIGRGRFVKSSMYLHNDQSRVYESALVPLSHMQDERWCRLL